MTFKNRASQSTSTRNDIPAAVLAAQTGERERRDVDAPERFQCGLDCVNDRRANDGGVCDEYRPLRRVLWRRNRGDLEQPFRFHRSVEAPRGIIGLVPFQDLRQPRIDVLRHERDQRRHADVRLSIHDEHGAQCRPRADLVLLRPPARRVLSLTRDDGRLRGKP
jgi:hypothetical protein